MTPNTGDPHKGFKKGSNAGTEVCAWCNRRTWKSRMIGDNCEDCVNDA